MLGLSFSAMGHVRQLDDKWKAISRVQVYIHSLQYQFYVTYFGSESSISNHVMAAQFTVVFGLD